MLPAGDDLYEFLLRWFLLLLLPPTLLYFLVRALRAGARPRRVKIAGWLCFWVGELCLLLIGVGLWCWADFAFWWERGLRAAALVYGLAMAVAAFAQAWTGLRLVRLGLLLLGSEVAGPGQARAFAPGLRRASLATLLAALLAGFFLPAWVPFPGREWSGLIFLALVILPLVVASALGLGLSALLRRLR
jgi:hypothetical protein